MHRSRLGSLLRTMDDALPLHARARGRIGSRSPAGEGCCASRDPAMEGLCEIPELPTTVKDALLQMLAAQSESVVAHLERGAEGESPSFSAVFVASSAPRSR